MTFKVPPSKATQQQNRFEFEIDGKTYDVPKLGFISGEVIELLAEADRTGSYIQMKAANIAVFGPKGTPAGDAVRTLDDDQLDALLEEYKTASGITPGESSASTDS